VSFIVVFVGGSTAAYESEGSIRSKDYCWVVDGSEVGELYTFEIVIGLKVKWVSAEVSLPFRWDLIKALGCQVKLGAVLQTAGLEYSFQMFPWSSNYFLYIFEGVEYVEAESEF